MYCIIIYNYYLLLFYKIYLFNIKFLAKIQKFSFFVHNSEPS